MRVVMQFKENICVFFVKTCFFFFKKNLPKKKKKKKFFFASLPGRYEDMEVKNSPLVGGLVRPSYGGLPVEVICVEGHGLNALRSVILQACNRTEGVKGGIECNLCNTHK